ncbi:MAG TPA: prolipoprotein diacylglyceryl transferase [Candidatus Dormibacteraeota bacterium]|nr:prolipoprotein diacylglyceryl transferase [Candidatus Dormibacteraeota bacterium]
MIDWTPNSIALQLGPFSLFWYGIAYASGLALAYWIMTRQARALGENAALIGNGLIIVAVAALIGGRLYHVIDQWQLYKDDLIKIVLPPYSGLGIFGGFVTGTIAVLALVRYHKVSAWRWADIVAPGIFLMQAAGRWGNFFNQELYGPPTNLPWGIAIDCAHRVVEYPCDLFPLATTHFQPLFLYESISAMIGAATLVWLSRRPRPWLRVGDMGAIMLIWIGGVRFMIEFLRIGNWRIGDIPTAQYFGAAFVLIGIAILVIRRRQHAPQSVTEEMVLARAAAEDAKDDDPFADDEFDDDVDDGGDEGEASDDVAPPAGAGARAKADQKDDAGPSTA